MNVSLLVGVLLVGTIQAIFFGENLFHVGQPDAHFRVDSPYCPKPKLFCAGCLKRVKYDKILSLFSQLLHHLPCAGIFRG
jgi:hypothetical protein